MKKVLSLILAVILVFSVCGCAAKKTPGEMNVYVLSGPTGIGALNLWDKAEKGETLNKYNFTLTGANDEIVAAVSKGEADIAAVATNLASTIYNRTEGKVTVLAVNTLGVLYMLTNGEEIATVSDLKGKTIYSPGQGANPEYILRYVLKGNGVDPDNDVTIKFVSEGSELLPVWAQEKDAVIMAPQPVATMLTTNNKDAKTVFDMSEEWGKIATDSTLMMGCVIVNNEYLANNKDAVEIFMDEYKESVEAALTNVDATAKLCVEKGIIPKEPIAKKAIPYCGLKFVSGEEMKKGLSGYLKVMFEANAKSVGGKLPADDFYYVKN